MKQTLKIGITVLVVATMAMSGIALAQTDESIDQARDAVTRIAEHLQALVDDGTLTAEQATAVAEHLADNVRKGRGGPKGHFGSGIAEFLGMETEDFRAALQEYDTLAAIAEANGSSAEALVDFMVGQAEERIAQAVEDGKLTQDEADEKLSGLEAEITERVNSEIPERGEGRRGGRGPGGPGDAGFGGSSQGGVGVSA